MKKSLKYEISNLYTSGLTYDEISKQLGCSKGTISYHISKLAQYKRSKSSKEKLELIKKIEEDLPKTREEFDLLYKNVLSYRNYYKLISKYYKRPSLGLRVGNIPAEYWANLRQKFKKKLVDYKGGSCEMCGYNRSVNALQFHHIDPNTKSFNISDASKNKNFEVIKPELDKCMLLCANCHAEIHDRFITR